MWKKKLSKDRQKSPIFLLGTHRSGTTLLQRIVNSSEDALIWGEHGGFLSQIAEAYFLNFEDSSNKLISFYVYSSLSVFYAYGLPSYVVFSFSRLA